MSTTAIAPAGSEQHAMRIKRTLRSLWDAFPVYAARDFVRQTWRGIPGPLPVKAVLFILAAAEPSPFGEMALAAFGTWNGARIARKAGA